MSPFIKPVFCINALFLTCHVYGAQIAWNTWSSATAGSIATSGSPVDVTFAVPSPSLDVRVTNYPSYAPSTSYADGVIVENAPVPANNIIRLQGGNANINTVTFSTPVVDPVMAIWSLGQPNSPASFVFQNATPVFVAGGPSNEYLGSPIAVSGNTVSGSESNGTVQFIGTYNSISWTNPQSEYWYGFNVGIVGPATVPLPAAAWMMFSALAAIGPLVRLRNSR